MVSSPSFIMRGIFKQEHECHRSWIFTLHLQAKPSGFRFLCTSQALRTANKSDNKAL